jgi:tRNA A37 methylthiotransferase MiaB
VLRRMRRWHTREQYRCRVLEIADRVRPLGLGADIIVGFPGETDVDHSHTRALVEELPYTYLHVFPYSVRHRTRAADLPDRVAAHVAAERSRELREIGVGKGSAHSASRAGTDALVAVETFYTEHQHRLEQVDAARGAADLTWVRYQSGLTNYLEVLSIQNSLFSAELAASQTLQQHFTALVSLYKALGGGWSVEEPPP